MRLYKVGDSGTSSGRGWRCTIHTVWIGHDTGKSVRVVAGISPPKRLQCVAVDLVLCSR